MGVLNVQRCNKILVNNFNAFAQKSKIFDDSFNGSSFILYKLSYNF
jgi:hypothetical protein